MEHLLMSKAGLFSQLAADAARLTEKSRRGSLGQLQEEDSRRPPRMRSQVNEAQSRDSRSITTGHN